MSNTDDGCEGCTRRAVMQGLVAASALVPIGCRLEDVGEPTDTPDAGSGMGTGFAMCGANMCVDLTHPLNAPLLEAGGSRVVTVAGDKVLVVRQTAADEFTTLSGVCTHAGCTVRFVAGSTSFACPCHGSKFAIDGAVTTGPATRTLKTYQNDFDAGTMTLTIML